MKSTTLLKSPMPASAYMDGARFANAVVSFALRRLPGGLVSMYRLERLKMVLWQLKPWSFSISPQRKRLAIVAAVIILKDVFVGAAGSYNR